MGKEHESFMAIMSAPHQYLRCSECGFNDSVEKDFDMLSNNLEDAIDKWNQKIAEREAGETSNGMLSF